MREKQSMPTTVDGKNPAPPGNRINYQPQLVRECFHQQYHVMFWGIPISEALYFLAFLANLSGLPLPYHGGLE